MDYLDAADSLTSFENSPRNAITTILAAAACLLTLCIYFDSRNKHQYWSKRGVKGPKPIPVLGTLIDHLTGNRLEKEVRWTKEYGKVYGIFYGTEPQLVVADPEILLQLSTKDFDVFPNHVVHEIVSSYLLVSLVFQQGADWRRMRALMSPTFTCSKIRRMFRFLDDCSDDLVLCFKGQMSQGDKENNGLNVKDIYTCFAMDAIASCCYGLKLERANSADGAKGTPIRDEFVRTAMQMFRLNFLRISIFSIMPDSLVRLIGFKTHPDSNFEPMAKLVKNLIDQRRQTPTKKFDDYLQLLIEAKLGDEMESDEQDSAENHHAAQNSGTILEDQKRIISEANGGSNSAKTRLTDFEILANATTFLVIGLKTTSVLLAHFTYCLAFHPEIQDHLYEEVMKIAHFDEQKKKYQFDYDALTSCAYLDACLSEVLRQLPPVMHLDRKSDRDYHLDKYNIFLPKGSVIQLAYYAIMNDPATWPEPQRFNPDRFMPAEREKIVPGSYCPFGLGLRHCLGMRFSLTEAKLAMAKLIVNYRFKPAPGTKFPAEPKRSLYLHEIKSPYVIATDRW